MDYLLVTFWALIGSVFSLAGGVLLISNTKLRVVAVRYGLPFGAGALLAAAFIGVLPEAIEGTGIHQALMFALAGFLVFFVLERLLDWFHHHEEHHHDNAHGPKDQTHQKLVIIGDTLHNSIDGIALGAAFLVDPALGIGAALAIAAHEIPQEIGDFSILLGKGMRPRNVIIVNLLSALATVVMALLTYTVGDAIGLNPAPLLAVAAGFFFYIAASDIIPDIHEKPAREGNLQAAMLLIGVALISLIITLTPHSHAGEAHHDNHDDHSHMEHEDEHEEDSTHLEDVHDEHGHDDHGHHE